MADRDDTRWIWINDQKYCWPSYGGTICLLWGDILTWIQLLAYQNDPGPDHNRDPQPRADGRGGGEVVSTTMKTMPRTSGICEVKIWHDFSFHISIDGSQVNLNIQDAGWLRDCLNEWLAEQEKPQCRDDGEVRM